MLNLKGKTILVTGASSGIGACLARYCDKLGANVILSARSIEKLSNIISGMSNPQNVIQFLDITSLWNPSLLMVMLGAIPVTTLGFYWIEKHHKTAYGSVLHLPGKTRAHSGPKTY